MICTKCGEAGEFYSSKKQVFTVCKRCWNAACVARKKADKGYADRQYKARRAWALANPERKMVHEGRALFLTRRDVPAQLVEIERLAIALAGRAA